MDFCSVAQSCKSLKEMIFELFQRKHKILKLKLNSNAILSGKTTAETIRLFQTFGSSIVDLEIEFYSNMRRSDPNSTAIIDAVIRCCTALKSLKLVRITIPDNRDMFIGIGKLFEQLNKLHLVGVFIDKMDEIDFDWSDISPNDASNHQTKGRISPNGHSINIFSKCSSLLDLKVADSYCFYRVISDNLFPKIEHFMIEDDRGFMDDFWDGFILRHPKLKTFILATFDYHIPTIKILSENCKNLQKLQFWTLCPVNRADPEPSLEVLAKFRDLKELTCSYVSHYMPDLVKVLPKLTNSLEVLDLSHGTATFETIRIISELKKLKVLRLSDITGIMDLDINCSTTDDFKHMLRATLKLK